MRSMSHASRGALFRELHRSEDVLVLANPWDVGSARLFENLGFKALATTSAGLAFSLGRRDGDGAVSADETFAHVAAVIAATRVPVSADLENGFGESPGAVAATIRRAGEVGLAGASIEDATYRAEDPIFERSLAVERIQAAVEAARSLARPFVLTARAEGFIRNRPDLEETLARLAAFDAAGADVLFAPGLPDAAAIRRATSASQKPFNYVAGSWAKFTIAELRGLGVRRISVGGSYARKAYYEAMLAAREVLERGTFDFADGVPSVGATGQLIDPEP
jgi:2-methylisocitrate lyase-like PEP mutase family enzyme